MSISITFNVAVNGLEVDVDSIELRDQYENFGVRINNTETVVVAAGTTIPRISTGTYTYSFSPADEDLIYEYSVHLVYQGQDYYYNALLTSAGTSSLVVVPDPSHYTSQAEVYRVLGTEAVDLINEDVSNVNTEYLWRDFLNDVDETIAMYVEQHYDPATLYSNEWVRRRATYLLCNLLSQRRGANELYRARVERIYDDLNGIRDNRFHIPKASPRNWQGPVVRNYIIQDRFLQNPVRVQDSMTTGESYPSQKMAWEPFIYTYPQY